MRPRALVTAPGQRVDVLVQAGSAGTYALQALPNDQGYPSPDWAAGAGRGRGRAAADDAAYDAAAGAAGLDRDDEIYRQPDADVTADQPEFPPAGNYQEFAFLIDGRTFDIDRVDQRVDLGAVEEWTIVNDHEDDHVFHIHTNPSS